MRKTTESDNFMLVTAFKKFLTKLKMESHLIRKFFLPILPRYMRLCLLYHDLVSLCIYRHDSHNSNIGPLVAWISTKPMRT